MRAGGGCGPVADAAPAVPAVPAVLASFVEVAFDFSVAVVVFVGLDNGAVFAAVSFPGDGDAGSFAGVDVQGEVADCRTCNVAVLELDGEDALYPDLFGAAGFEPASDAGGSGRCQWLPVAVEDRDGGVVVTGMPLAHGVAFLWMAGKAWLCPQVEECWPGDAPSPMASAYLQSRGLGDHPGVLSSRWCVARVVATPFIGLRLIGPNLQALPWRFREPSWLCLLEQSYCRCELQGCSSHQALNLFAQAAGLLCSSLTMFSAMKSAWDRCCCISGYLASIVAALTASFSGKRRFLFSSSCVGFVDLGLAGLRLIRGFVLPLAGCSGAGF